MGWGWELVRLKDPRGTYHDGIYCHLSGELCGHRASCYDGPDPPPSRCVCPARPWAWAPSTGVPSSPWTGRARRCKLRCRCPVGRPLHGEGGTSGSWTSTEEASSRPLWNWEKKKIYFYVRGEVVSSSWKQRSVIRSTAYSLLYRGYIYEQLAILVGIEDFNGNKDYLGFLRMVYKLLDQSVNLVGIRDLNGNKDYWEFKECYIGDMSS